MRRRLQKLAEARLLLMFSVEVVVGCMQRNEFLGGPVIKLEHQIWRNRERVIRRHLQLGKMALATIERCTHA